MKIQITILSMVEGDQELNQYFVENYFYTVTILS